jgi:hypothetical protein
MNQIKKIKNNPNISEIYYWYGETDNFDKFRGKEKWLLMKESERFSNDRHFEMDGESKSGGYMGKFFGLQKRKWKFNENGIGVKK